MRDILDTVSTRYDGLISAAALGEAGLTVRAVQALVACGDLVRIRRGIYVLGPMWRDTTDDGRYRLFVRATAASAAHPLIFSHHSAAVLHGLPIIGRWPQAVHVIAADATGGSNARYTTSHRGVAEPSTVQIDGLTVTSLARTLIDMAATSNLLVGVTMIDHALRVGGCPDPMPGRRGAPPVIPLTCDDLLTELAAVRPRAGARQAERSIGFSNGLSANPGETLSRVRIFELGFEVPELQEHFRVNGRDFWVDFWWRGVRKIGEFDGEQKYTRGAVLGDRDPGDVVVQEKWREDLLRRHVASFCRWGWATAYSPARFSAFLTEHDVPRARTEPSAQVCYRGAV